MKKFFILIVILISVFSTCTAYASSINFSDMKDDPGEEAVRVLSNYKIINGYPDNTFRPDNTITRAEMAKIVTVAAGYYEYSKNMTSVYSDMHGHWAESYVELAKVLNIVRGITPDIYGPDNIIEFDEAITIIVRLLGYTDESLQGQWPRNYYDKARELNLFENITNHAEFATRRDISLLLYNALDCDIVKVNESKKINKTGKKLISLLGSMETKVVTLEDLKTNNGFNYTDYLFNKWDIYYDTKGKPVYMSNSRYNEFSGTVTSLLENRVIFVTDSSGNVRAFKLPEIPIVFNGALGQFNSLNNSKVKVVYEDDSYNGNVIGVISYKSTDEILMSKSDLYKSGSRTFAKKYLPMLSSQVNFNRVFVYGDASSLYDIKENDILYFYETDELNSKKSTISIEVVRSQVEGTVSKSEKSNNVTYYTINNKAYKTAANYIFTENASVNDQVKLILDKNNDIVKLFVTSYGKAPTTYGIVTNSSSGTNNLATTSILDQYGNTRTYSLAGNSNVITYVDYGTYVQYITSLNRNDIVKFDPVNQGAVKIINNMNTTFIANTYNEATQYIGNNYRVSPYSFIVYEENGRYQIIKPYQLDSYIVGKAYINSYGHVDALYLTKGLKPKEVINTIVPEQSTTQGFSGTIYDIVKSYKKIDNNTTQVEFYNKGGAFYVSSTSSAAKKIPYLLNSYIRASISDNILTGIDKVTPETDKIKINAVYANQLQIDNITYMEYSSSLKVYVCTLNSSGSITSVRAGSKSDIQPGSTAQLYDIYGSFDGIVDVVLIFK